MKFMTQFTKEHVLSLLQETVGTLWYIFVNIFCNRRCEKTVVEQRW